MLTAHITKVKLQFEMFHLYSETVMYSSPSKSNVPRVLKANTVLVTSSDSNSEWEEAAVSRK